MQARATIGSIIGLLYVCLTAGAQAPDTLWTRLYGGPGNDYGWHLNLTGDGGYVVTGSFARQVGDTDLYLIKTDENGDTLWTSAYGGDHFDAGRWVYPTLDNGYFVAAVTSYDNRENDIYLIKTDSSGNVLWDKSFGGSQDDGVVGGAPTSDGGYILAGYTASFGSGLMDVWLLKLDANGDTLWTRTYGGDNYDSGRSVIQAPDGGYFILCNINYGFDDTGLTLIRTDADGDTLWTKRYCQNHATGVSIISTHDGGYMILANTLAFGDEFDIQLLRIESDGDSLWTKIIGGLEIDMAGSIGQTDDDGFIICGITGPYFDEDIYVIKTDADGDTLWSSTFAGIPYGNDVANCIRETPDGGLILTGSLSTPDVMQEVCLIRFEGEEIGLHSIDLQTPAINLLCNYPNPFNAGTKISFMLFEPQNIRLEVYDHLGRLVGVILFEYRQAGSHTVLFDASGLSSGIYFYRLQAGETIETEKMILLK